jgi:phosphonoacetate hydrolase
MRATIRIVVSAVAFAFNPFVTGVVEAQVGHPPQISVNGKTYDWPKRPVVVVLVDGGDPEYVKAGLDGDLLPNLKKFMTEGFASVARGAMPSFTNPNNMSVITGVPPAMHGISGNFFFNPDTGKEMMMDRPEFLRADSILAKFSEQGAKVVAITAKDKLTDLLAHQLKNGIVFSSEKADKCSNEKNGISNCLEYVGRPLPDPYSGDLSLFVLEAGIKILEREKPDLMYLTLSDYLQHTYAPGSKETNEFYAKLDDALGRLVSLGATVAITGDHGMNDKSKADGAPNVVFLQDVLDQEYGVGKTRVILPITDPYVKHHGALGSYATVFLDHIAPAQAMKVIDRQPGVQLVMERYAAAKAFDLPADRIGDIIVVSDRGTVLGKKNAELDLSQLAGHRLRSHGGLADCNVYLIFSRPLNDKYANIAVSRELRNFDVFEFALNGVK